MKKITIISILLLSLLELLKIIIDKDFSMLMFFTGTVFLFTKIFTIGDTFKKPVLSFLILGTVLLIYNQQTLSIWVSGVNSMANIIGILVVMQLFNIPIKVGNYGDAVETFLKKFLKTPLNLFIFITILTNILGSFLLFGTIPVVLSLVKNSTNKLINNSEKLISNAVTRAYALVVLWTPGAVNIMIVSQVTGVRWSDIFLPGLFLNILGVILSIIIEKRIISDYKKVSLKSSNQTINCQNKNKDNSLIKMSHIIIVVIGLILMVLFFSYLGLGSNSSQIMLSGILIVLLWFVFLENFNIKNAFIEYLNTDIPKMSDLSIFFISIGFFSKALETSGLLNGLAVFSTYIYNYIGIWIINLIPLIIVIMSCAGIHPFASMVIIGNLVISMNIEVSKDILALTMLFGASISYLISPFAGIVLTMSKLINAKVFDITLNWNALFCSFYLIIGFIFIYLYHLFLS